MAFPSAGTLIVLPFSLGIVFLLWFFWNVWKELHPQKFKALQSRASSAARDRRNSGKAEALPPLVRFQPQPQSGFRSGQSSLLPHTGHR